MPTASGPAADLAARRPSATASSAVSQSASTNPSYLEGVPSVPFRFFQREDFINGVVSRSGLSRNCQPNLPLTHRTPLLTGLVQLEVTLTTLPSRTFRSRLQPTPQ